MDKPTSVNILGKEYSIKYVDNPAEVDLQKRSSLWGQIDFWERKIRIYDNGRTYADLLHTLLHEILHGIETELNLKHWHSNDKDHHDELDVVALALSDTLIRNDWLKK